MSERSRKLTTGFLILMIITALTLFAGMAAAKEYNRERLIFVMDDPKGDDHGPGSYKYPTDSIFDPKKELFDLTRFAFTSRRNNYYFDMSFPRITDPWGAPEGFSHTVIQIYIADDPDRGRVEPFKEGSNVVFEPRNPWQYLIKVVSFRKTGVYWDSDYQGADGRQTGVTAVLQPDKKSIRVTVPKALLPGNPYKWRYYVLVGSQEGSGPDNFRPVRAKVGQWYFGGGTDTDYSPNVIDMLAPPKIQEQMLSAYSVSDRRQAIIRPVGPTEVSLSWGQQFLDRVVGLLLKMKVKI